MLFAFNTLKTYNNNQNISSSNNNNSNIDTMVVECDNNSNYTGISCNNSSSSSSGCMSDSSCLKSIACPSSSISAIGCCCCLHCRHSNCSSSLMLPSKAITSDSPTPCPLLHMSALSSSSSQDISNYMQSANCRNTCITISNNTITSSSATMASAMDSTLEPDADADDDTTSRCNNTSVYNVANTICNNRRELNMGLTGNGSGSSTNTCNSFPWMTFSHISNNTLTGLFKLAIILIFLAMCDTSQAALTNVNLFIEPPAVRRSQSVTLRCQYSLEGAPLYSVKFYRGQLEFFRYTPDEYPNTKVFPYPGIKVDESVSNATQVVIRNVNFGLSGNFSCEVTADAPLFSTATAYAQMQVVEFPDKRPQLFTEHTRYEPGDVLRANCSTPPSRPRAELRFTINNIPVSSEETQYIRTVDNLIASRLSLKVQLQAVHFAVAAGANAGNSNSHMMNALGPGGATYTGGSGAGATGGALLLRCTAQIGDLYQEYKEIELGTPQRDPVPARVTSSGGGIRGFFESYFGPSSGSMSYTTFSKALLITCIVVIYAAAYNRR
ncbi:beaten path IIb [Haematobia irritans]|uniref:beaten path IIb n=1 Tax=Haematobia irritans TaxID=7368 RepID=UPI003F5093FF